MKREFFIGGLDWQVTEQQLQKFFEENGVRVSRCVLITDRYNGASRGFGFITTATDEGAQRVNDLNGTYLAGRPVRISEARPRAERPGGGRSQFDSIFAGAGEDA
jgi:RNA recognition motif-containing protein